MIVWALWLVLADAAPVVPFDLIGPTGVAAVGLVAVAALWREDRRVYKERVDELKVQIVEEKATTSVATAGWREQTAANAELAKAWNERNRIDAERAAKGAK